MLPRVMVSRHSAFYSPLIATVARGFGAGYSILKPGQRSYELIRDGVVDVMQSAPSSNWGPMAKGISPLPVHFALINRRDGFFLAGRNPGSPFSWKDLEGKRLIADHGGQPLAMLKYAVKYNGVEWEKIDVADRGSPAETIEAFRRGDGDYVHFQAPGIEPAAVAVGASMPEVAFSTLCCSREFLKTDALAEFLAAYRKTRAWVASADPGEVASLESAFFPGVTHEALSKAVERYQKLGTWTGSAEIAEDLYRQALAVFGTSQPFAAVCV
ncbi:MAG: hypothetical protein KGN84_04795 [Acidobacteriota bacterium]|nr:hypothetical protein [Acidobacteriota bacterium]